MLKVCKHPLIDEKLTRMRNKDTTNRDFRQNLDEIASLMVYEVTADIPTVPCSIQTPMTQYEGTQLAKDVVLAPILRAGLGMVQGFLNMMPNAKVAHIGMERDEQTLQPRPYYEKIPSGIEDAYVLVLDPMLATGGSSIAALDHLKKRGARHIKLICLVGAPEGVKAVEQVHPDVEIYLAALDEQLNEKGYILPGLGDAGDRIFGTEK